MYAEMSKKQLEERLYEEYLADEFDKFSCAVMVTQAYVYKKTNKFLWTFASYDEKEEVFSDRNVFPKGCIIKMEKIYI